MKKSLFCFIMGALIFSTQYAAAEASNWYFYVWSLTSNSGGDIGQFQTTDDSNVFILKSASLTEAGVNFCVRSGDWSETYGWDDEGGSVTTTGVAVRLASATQATGWCALAVGTYDITFNLTDLTIRFDSPSSDEEEETDELRQFLRGGDLSMLTYVEDWGAKFYDRDGNEGDVFDILQSYGVNFVRLRLYNKPGTPITNGSTTYRTPLITAKYWNGDGTLYAGPDDIASLALRAKNHGMKICLSIYLSDYWSGATEQYIPSDWADATTLEALGDSVYDYVTRYMQRMKAQNTIPEYVSIGNESNYGILFQTTDGSYVDYGGHTTRNGISNAVYLFNKAYDAVKAVSSTTQVIIHHSYGHQGKISACRSFFKNLKDNGCEFDIVGGSYYPYWASEQGATDQSPTGMLAWAADMENYIGKPIMIMEVGYSWTPYRSSGRNGGNYEGQLHLNGTHYNEASEEGQAAFIQELHEAIDKDYKIIGYLYWDPIFVDQKHGSDSWWIKTCWAEKYSGSGTTWWEDGNVISNTTWFDYDGKALPVLDVIKTLKEEDDTPTSVEMAGSHSAMSEEPINARKYLQGETLIIEVNNTRFDILGHRL